MPGEGQLGKAYNGNGKLAKLGKGKLLSLLKGKAKGKGKCAFKDRSCMHDNIWIKHLLELCTLARDKELCERKSV